MNTYTVIIPTTNTEGGNVYDTESGHVNLQEQEMETAPIAPAYEVVEKGAEAVAAERGWVAVSPQNRTSQAY